MSSLQLLNVLLGMISVYLYIEYATINITNIMHNVILYVTSLVNFL